ncbi:hypothetical protein MGU_09485 [Metarhizium guizhouense ARSEF 977]|uniref:Uncharacterized protein n=1 Tax=Metarhizium guizhouense (strain ARSEF 977) TaxID=1276136 RepID=A0A0B4HUN4_METGA|nr:hypothetical protein MGU_09485 [Metarhizium guizhouense ARSEF 977]
MSRQPTFTSIIHLRDFVDAITADPTRENAPNYVEIQTDLNIFEEDGFHDPNIATDPIGTRIHTYLTQEQRELYLPGAFFYADGRCFTALSMNGTLEISTQTLSLMRQPRHFTIETSAYDASKAAPAHFSVVCFLEGTKRWRKVKTPASGALLSVTAKIAGRTRDTNLLALRVLDLAYLPRPPSAPTPTPTDTPPSNRSDRWRGRVPSTSTPSKRPRISDPANEAANPSDRNTTLPDASSSALVFPHSELTTEPISAPISPSTTADPEESSPTPGMPLVSDGGARPRRNRHPPKKWVDVE